MTLVRTPFKVRGQKVVTILRALGVDMVPQRHNIGRRGGFWKRSEHLLYEILWEGHKAYLRWSKIVTEASRQRLNDAWRAVKRQFRRRGIVLG